MRFADLPFNKNFEENKLRRFLGAEKTSKLIQEGLLWEVSPGVLRKE
jgi:hypothetical protein